MNPDFWNEKYRTNDHLYSDRPNTFLQAYYEKQKDRGVAFIPGDGDGRNGLWLARQGFEVEALDYSEVAVRKANERALAERLPYKNQCLSIDDWKAKPKTYDTAAIIFLHVPQTSMIRLIQKILASVKPGGSLLIEVFSKDQLSKSSGGPKDPNLLFSTDTFEDLVADFEVCQAQQRQYELNEGPLHTGICSVINVMALGRKNAPTLYRKP